MPTDTREMLAIHDALRQEFAMFGLLVKGTPVDDAERAAVVGGHIMMMTMILHSHHEGEDALLWPVLRERVPDQGALLDRLAEAHHEMDPLVDSLQAQAKTWMDDPSAYNRAGLHVAVFPLERALLAHLSEEEEQVLPLAAAHLTQEEFAAIGEHARAGLSQEQLAIGLGIILDDTTAELGEVVLSSMPADARAGFEQFGQPVYRAYRDRLLDRM